MISSPSDQFSKSFVLVALLGTGLVASTVPPAFAQSSTWTTTGSMSTARIKHTATLLQNGHVLAVGGVNSKGFLSSAELYHPSTGKWTSTGSMALARGEHTATLLPNGDVLVAGGLTNGNSQIGTSCTATAELFNRSTGEWTSTGSMTLPRGNHAATLLPDGKVLVAGGLCSGGFIYPDNSAEVYDPSTGTWKATRSMNFARASAGSTLLVTGEVLVAGGNSTSAAGSSAELFDASKGCWTVTGSMNTPRGTLQMIQLANGTALVLGGTGLASYASQFYLPTNGSWHTIQYYVSPPRWGHTLTLLNTGKALAAGGNTKYGITSLARIYDPATNSWSNNSLMTIARQYHTATLLPNGQVLVTGGQVLNSNSTSTDFASAELYTS